MYQPDLQVASDCSAEDSHNYSVDSDGDIADSEVETHEESSNGKMKRKESRHKKRKLDDTSFEHETSGYTLVTLLDHIAQKYNSIFDQEDLKRVSLLRDRIVALEIKITEYGERLNSLVSIFIPRFHREISNLYTLFNPLFEFD
jgi:hypothetical protein